MSLASDSISSARAQRRWAPWIGVILTIAFAAALAWATWWLVWESAGSPHRWAHSLFLPVAILAVIGLFILGTERRWAKPTRQLTDLIPQIRGGDAPIDALDEIGGGLKPLVPIVQDLLHELRLERQAQAILHDEVRQRIANRTDALERQIGSLRQQATRDPLTRLYNRRMFDAYLPGLMEKCRSEEQDLSLLMIDVDHFKPLNDTLGHGAGDELLRNIAQIIKSGIRTQDAAFRIGGDEFVVILPGAGPKVAADVANRMKELVDALARPMKLALGPSLSIGIESMSALSKVDARELLKSADRKLYEMKGSRRSIVTRAAG
jgi:diguanylate cyclase (GGDEF)-like protein